MEAPGRLEISACGEREREPVLRIRGELDLSTISLLAEHVESQLAGGSPPVAFVLDLGGVTFMDSSGLRTLIELNERAHAEGWRLMLMAPEADAATLVLRMTGADEALPFVRGGRG